MDDKKSYLPPEIDIVEVNMETQVATSNPSFGDDLWDN